MDNKITEENINTVAYNLANLRKKDLSLTERSLAHLDEAGREMAKLLCTGNGITECDEFITAYRKFMKNLFCEDDERITETPEQNRKKLKSVDSEDAVNFSVLLCQSICKIKSEQGAPLTHADFFAVYTARTAGERIAYLRNPYSDTAFRIFSEVIKNASVSYPRDFAAVCEEVYYGRCRYCILPVETSDEGALSGFRRLIAKYELCPILSCPVSTAGGSQTTEFALFAKNIEFPPIDNKTVCEKRKLFSFRLDAPTEKSFNKTVRALHLYGLRILKMDSSPVAWDEGRYSFEITVDCGEKDLTSALLYLILEIPEYTPIGYYTQISLSGG